MALRPRFVRQVAVDTGTVNPNAGAEFNELANTLENFSARRDQDLDRAAAAEGLAAGELAGAEGAAPDASDATIRGRAFNQGVILSHQAALQTDIRDSIARLEVDNPADPDAFNAGVTGLSEGLLAEIPPALQGFAQQRIADYAGRAQVRIIENQRNELLAQASADLERGVEGFVEDATTAAFEGDIALVEARRQELDEVLGQALESEIMDEGSVLQVRDDFERAVTAQEVLGNFNRLLLDQGPEQAAESIKRWQATKPSSAGLTPEEHEAITRQMVTLRNRVVTLTADERQRASAAEKAEIAARKARVNDAIKVLQSGFTPDAEQAEQVAADLAALGDAELALDFDVAQAIAGQVHRFKRLPGAQREAELVELEQVLRGEGASREEVALLDALRDTDAKVNRALERDPRGYVNREGLLDDSPLDFSSAEALIESLDARTVNTEVGRELTGEPLPLLSATEAEQLAQVYADSEIEGRVGLLGIITAGAGDAATATLGQLDAKGHTRMALLGDMVMSGQGTLARDVMRGEAVLSSDPGIKPKRADYQASVDDLVGAAYSDAPALREEFLGAAFAKYAELKASTGDLSDVFEPRLFEQALEAVIPTASFNGRRVAVPPGIDESLFDDWVDSWTPALFEGAGGGTGEDMLELTRDRGRLTELGRGRYGVLLNSALTDTDLPLVFENGEPVVLEFGATP